MDRLQYARLKHSVYPAFLYSKEKWITLDNGTHVQIDGEGNIVGGPSALKEKGITNLSHFGDKSSTAVDKRERSADTPAVSKPSTEQQETKMKTLTIKGSTVKAAQKLKEMGFTFNPSAKTWTMNAEPGKSRYGQDGFLDSKGNFIGSEESITHSIRTHAKSQDVTLSTSDKPATSKPEEKTSSVPAKSESPEDKIFQTRRDTRNDHYQVGQSVRSDGKDYIVTNVSRPYQDDHGYWIHGVSTRPATEQEVTEINQRREAKAAKDAEHISHINRGYGGEMR